MGSKVLSLFFLTLIAVQLANSRGLKKNVKVLKSDVASLKDLVSSLVKKVQILWRGSDSIVNDESSNLLVTDGAQVCSLVDCDSNGYAYNTCLVAGASRVTDVNVATKRSSSACTLNYSYGITGASVWVDNGCRASFNVCYV